MIKQEELIRTEFSITVEPELTDDEISDGINSANQAIQVKREEYKKRYSGTDIALGNFSFRD